MIAARSSSLLAIVLLAAFPALAADRKPPAARTLGDLAGKTVELQPDAPIPDAERLARENYQRFLDLSKTDPKRAAEALRRLGDLELEAGERRDLGAGTQPLRAATYAPAVGLYRRLLAEHPDFPRNDLVLYQLARAQESGGDPLAALATLDQLVTRFPKTALLDEVQFRRGEILFSRERYEPAERAYAAVLALDAKSAFREQALYKRGWSQFKQEHYDEALTSFLALLDARLATIDVAEIDHYLDGVSRPTRELIDDTLRVMSLSFSYLDGEKTLRRTLHQHGDPSYSHLLYLSLAAQYLDEKRYTDAAGVLMGFVDAQPLHPRAPYLNMQAVASLEQGQFPGDALAARERFTRRFGLDQPYWKAQAPAAHPPVIAFLRESVWTLAQRDHAHAQAKGTSSAERERDFRAAAEGYRRYVAYFPADARAAQGEFLLGEVLFERGDAAAAVTAYESAAYDYPPHAQSAEAGYAALVAYQRHEAGLEASARAAWHRRLIDAELRFATTFPSDPHAPEARLDAARGLFAAAAFPDAIAAALPITAAADTDKRRAAWMVTGQAQFELKDYAAAEAAYREARRVDVATGTRDADLSERIAASIYRQAEQAKQSGDAERAAAIFLRVGQAAPDAKIRETADYDAAQALIAANNAAAAIPVLQAFRRDHPASPLVNAATASLALAYAARKDPAAAAEFERIANTPELPAAERQEALQHAARQYAANHDDANEARVLTLYVQRYPEAFGESLEAIQRLIDLAASRHDEPARTEASRRLIALDAGAGGKRSDRSRYLAARATLGLAQPLREAFLTASLKTPLKDSLKLKKTRMEAALAAYGKAADYGVAEVLTESTYRIGELYGNLAQALIASEKPKGLDRAALEQYDLLLQEQAFPFEEKAIALHEANVRRAREGLYDDWVRASYASLASLVPGRYARPERREVTVDALR